MGAGRGGRGGGRSRVQTRDDRDRGNPYTTKVPKKFLLGRVVYVGNLSWRSAWQDLKDHFKPAGNILRADVMMGQDGRSRGCGLVEFSTIGEAKDAIDTLNGTVLEDRVITVREDKETSIAADAASAPRRIFVGNLHYHTRWMDLKDLFQTVGDVVRADVAEEPETGRSKGFGVVEMATIKDAKTALDILQESELFGRKIYLKPDDDKSAPYSSNGANEGGSGRSVNAPQARSDACYAYQSGTCERGTSCRFSHDQRDSGSAMDSDGGILGRLGSSLQEGRGANSARGGKSQGNAGNSGGGTKVHCGNLSWDTSDDDLRQLLSTAGPLVMAEVAVHEDTGRSKGWGLVEFVSPSGAAQAVEILQGTNLNGRPVSVKVDRA